MHASTKGIPPWGDATETRRTSLTRKTSFLSGTSFLLVATRVQQWLVVQSSFCSFTKARCLAEQQAPLAAVELSRQVSFPEYVIGFHVG